MGTRLNYTIDVGLTGSGGTQVTDYPDLIPDGNGSDGLGFTCAVRRATERLLSGGLTVRIVDPGTNASPTRHDSRTPSTLRGTLTVFAVREDHDGGDPLIFAMTDPLLLCDHAADPPYVANELDILELGAGNNGVCEKGDLLKMVWQETGDPGAYDADAAPVGVRPSFHILAWPFALGSV